MRSQNDRRQIILHALADERCTHGEPVESSRVESWLGRPYGFAQTLAALVDDGLVVKQQRTRRSGRSFDVYSLAN